MTISSLVSRVEIQLEGESIRLLVGCDEDWGYWVSVDHINRIYSSRSVSEAVENWIACKEEGITNVDIRQTARKIL